MFTMFWTALTFPAQRTAVRLLGIGLFCPAGLAGFVAAQPAGLLRDCGWSLPATGAGWALALAAFALAGVAGDGGSVGSLLLAIVLLDIGIQGLDISTRYACTPSLLRPAPASIRPFVACNFSQRAIGSAAATALWSAGGCGGNLDGGAALC
ncbi:hypothetical protein ILP97_41935 [Amycolatopsis sp. H6(2020)]|nr:hypothetical protein [Amycolatopsis sp. H6(2020)]